MDKAANVLVRLDLADTVNITLMKAGGTDSALQINAVARAAHCRRFAHRRLAE